MTEVPMDELVGQFEKIEEQELKAKSLSAQAKALKDDNTKRFSDNAKDYETDAKTIKRAYDFWKRAKESEQPEAVDDDVYTLVSALSVYLADEEA